MKLQFELNYPTISASMNAIITKILSLGNSTTVGKTPLHTSQLHFSVYFMNGQLSSAILKTD